MRTPLSPEQEALLAAGRLFVGLRDLEGGRSTVELLSDVKEPRSILFFGIDGASDEELLRIAGLIAHAIEPIGYAYGYPGRVEVEWRRADP